MSPTRAGQAALAVGIVGFLFLFPFDEWWTLTLGVLLLGAAVVLGCIAILTPTFLGQDPSNEEMPPSE